MREIHEHALALGKGTLLFNPLLAVKSPMKGKRFNNPSQVVFVLDMVSSSPGDNVTCFAWMFSWTGHCAAKRLSLRSSRSIDIEMNGPEFRPGPRDPKLSDRGEILRPRN